MNYTLNIEEVIKKITSDCYCGSSEKFGDIEIARVYPMSRSIPTNSVTIFLDRIKDFIPKEYRLRPSRKILIKRLKLIKNDRTYYEERIKYNLEVLPDDSLKKGIEKIVLAVNKIEQFEAQILNSD